MTSLWLHRHSSRTLGHKKQLSETRQLKSISLEIDKGETVNKEPCSCNEVGKVSCPCPWALGVAAAGNVYGRVS
jgi:hypothetical protein